MPEATIRPNPTAHDRDDSDDSARPTRTWVTVIVATAVLYFAREILLPIAVAVVLAVIFSPIATRLERFVGRLAGAAMVVIAAVGVVGALGYFMTIELSAVAVEVAGYPTNIANKLSGLQSITPPWVQRIEQSIEEVQRQVERSSPAPKARKPPVIVAQATPAPVTAALKPIIPLLSAIAEMVLVTVLLFFLLYGRYELRDRIVRLATRARIAVASQAIEAAGEAVGRYLLLFSMINLSFGIAAGLVVWMLGLPNPAFWGALAFVLRFIPYIGAMTSAILPTIVAFAVFPGWGKSLEVLGSFLIIDQCAAWLIEPVLIGRGIGVSPVALLISVMYWTWLWGPTGLLLATPLTACLKVAGDYIPQLGFLSILLGADSTLEDYHDYYRSLLELDQSSAHSIAIRYCDEHGLEPMFDDVIAPALIMMGEEREQDHISEANQQFIVDTTRELIVELGNRYAKPRMRGRVRMLGICAPSESHSMGLHILLELLRIDGAAASFVGENKTADEVRDFVKRFAPEVVCLSCTINDCMPAAVELVKAMRADSPHLTIIAGGRAALTDPAALLKAGCSQVYASRNEARRAIRRLAFQRRRRVAIAELPPQRQLG
ncbi:MAG: AI-2E family transporter [Candidatus Binatus sp.]|uniref:AI-2E family transporter n=1 Tax=Candidatus Binatus sp. TaxID=2811406 RepID=UPI00271DE5D2|nr:AI-2E family transporter [Candidatus Binatus sp.]MDO8434488.1 AI-2E family transporter [Candidatus Binatus sp.]